MNTCPCCNQEVSDVPPKGLHHASGLTPLERKIVECLGAAYPRFLTIGNIVDFAYSDDPNGGPECAYSTIVVTISNLRKRMPIGGWHLPKCKSGRGGYSSYRLEKIK